MKKVRALRTVFWNGHRRRAGATFMVKDDEVNNSLFEVTGEASDEDLQAEAERSAPAQAPVRKGFIALMDEMGNPDYVPPQPTTMAEVELPENLL